MKYLLGFLVVLLVAWRWRTERTATRIKAQRQREAPRPQIEMVRCDHCGVHIPANEATPGGHGVYCSIAHRQKSES